MKIDIRIDGGRVIDPAAAVDRIADIFIKDNRIVDMPDNSQPEAKVTIDATGCIVLPGLIDFHAHYFAGGTEFGISPDSSFLPVGVTAAVDAGSAGTSNYDSFARYTACASRMRTFSFLNVSPTGLITASYNECIDPRYYDRGRIAELFERYQGQLIGLKVRQSKGVAKELGLQPLAATLDIAEQVGCPVVVHTTDPPDLAEDIVNMLRPGDIYCHVYNPGGDTILDQDGKVKQAFVAARQKGKVRFDTANGRIHFSSKIARAAIEQDFAPDVISTDLIHHTAYGEYVFGLPFVMMQYISLGMSLPAVIEACTATPAALLGMGGKIGTLRAGAFADVALFRIQEKEAVINDYFGDPMEINQWLLPQMTILDGKIAYRQIDFGIRK